MNETMTDKKDAYFDIALGSARRGAAPARRARLITRPSADQQWDLRGRIFG
jgi:hypothetical protein